MNKFRIWQKDSKFYKYFDLDNLTEFDYRYICTMTKLGWKKEFCTGLVDINDEDIYENDKLRLGEYEGQYADWIVTFQKGSFCVHNETNPVVFSPLFGETPINRYLVK